MTKEEAIKEAAEKYAHEDSICYTSDIRGFMAGALSPESAAYHREVHDKEMEGLSTWLHENRARRSYDKKLWLIGAGAEPEEHTFPELLRIYREEQIKK